MSQSEKNKNISSSEEGRSLTFLATIINIASKFKRGFERIFKNKNTDDYELQYLIDHGMKLGKNCHLYSVTTIDHGQPHLISIGDDVTISTNVTILTHDASTNVVKCGTKLGRVTIGNNVFVGTGTTILCNTTIGDNVIIGAGSVVTSNLPSGGVYAGIPVRYICSIEEYRKKYERLRQERPDFNDIRPWNTWRDATAEERKEMYDNLEDGVGFF